MEVMNFSEWPVLPKLLTTNHNNVSFSVHMHVNGCFFVYTRVLSCEFGTIIFSFILPSLSIETEQNTDARSVLSIKLLNSISSPSNRSFG